MNSKRIQEKVKRDYDLIASEFSKSRQKNWKDFDVFLPYLNKNARILDLGCGNGRLINFLSEHGFKSYTGMDQSEGMLNHARTQFPKNTFIQGDFSSLDDLHGEFDIIFAIASFQHLPPKDQAKALNSWVKKLAPNGKILMINWNLFRLSFLKFFFFAFFKNPFQIFNLYIPWGKKVKRYYYAFTKMRLRKLFKNAGLKIEHQALYKNATPCAFFKAHNIISITSIAKNEQEI